MTTSFIISSLVNKKGRTVRGSVSPGSFLCVRCPPENFSEVCLVVQKSCAIFAAEKSKTLKRKGHGSNNDTQKKDNTGGEHRHQLEEDPKEQTDEVCHRACGRVYCG